MRTTKKRQGQKHRKLRMSIVRRLVSSLSCILGNAKIQLINLLTFLYHSQLAHLRISRLQYQHHIQQWVQPGNLPVYHPNHPRNHPLNLLPLIPLLRHQDNQPIFQVECQRDFQLSHQAHGQRENLRRFQHHIPPLDRRPNQQSIRHQIPPRDQPSRPRNN